MLALVLLPHIHPVLIKVKRYRTDGFIYIFRGFLAIDASGGSGDEMEPVYTYLITFCIAFATGCGYLASLWKGRKSQVEREDGAQVGEQVVAVYRKWFHTEVPWAILLVFFINSFVMSFKVNFFGAFISHEVPMSTPVFTQFWAFIYIPFSFKPLYAYIFENFSICGSKRKSFVIVCNLCISVTMLLMATVVKEVWQVFLVGFMESVFEAAAGMVVGLVVIDIASKDTTRIAKLQSEQTIARYAGTFLAYIIALPVSGCFNYKWSNRTALLFSALLPLFGVAAALFIPEHKPEATCAHGSNYSVLESTNTELHACDHTAVDSTITDSRDAGQTALDSMDRGLLIGSPDANQDVQDVYSEDTLEKKALLLFIPTILLFELLAIAVGIKVNLKSWNMLGLWKIIVGSCGGVLIGWLLGAAIGLSRWGNKEGSKTLVKIAIPCIYLFIVDAIPTTSDPFSSFKYSVLTDRCQQQLVSIVGTFFQIIGMYVYGLMFTGLKVEVTIVATTLLTTVVGLFELFKLQSSSLTLFQTWVLVDAFTSIFAPMFLISKEVVAAHYSFSLRGKRIQDDTEARNNFRNSTGFSPGILYSIYLTCFDIGGSASGFLSAAIALDLDINKPDFHNLSTMVLLCGTLFIATLVLVPLLRFSKRS
uniref:Uncharacterized protein n=1 Tax=Mucochytrium quahogii TaxID=96639 RepID=A0A7S2RSB5_9STRA|mmetsp:Transcript_5486/g.8495  ORF Transcript_5486/g.8495 Transcript_5486/m.8495 type:complete len:648 (+) Transcript_5486:40-1983(+)